MTPDLDLQLQVAIKALTDTVMPALDPDNKVAAEQLGLAIATFSMIRMRLPFEAARSWRALANAIDVAVAVSAELDDAELKSAVGAGRLLLSENNPAPRARDSQTRAIQARLGLIAREPDTPISVLRAIVEGARAELDLARAWCLPAGFEPDPREVPELAALL